MASSCNANPVFILLFALVCHLCFIYQQNLSSETGILADHLDQFLLGPGTQNENNDTASVPDNNGTVARTKTNWSEWVQEYLKDSFEQSYGHHIPHFCPLGKDMNLCLIELFETPEPHETNNRRQPQFTKHKFNTTLFDYQEHGENLPWWYRTLLGDMANEDKITSLTGPWHNLTGIFPVYRQCNMEKIGTKQWKQLACRSHNRTDLKFQRCWLNKPPEELLANRPGNNGTVKVPQFVMLRDPLERFLSGFIDKCIHKDQEPHCEPLSIFETGGRRVALRIKPPQDKRHFQDTARRMFEAYVDSFPLRWNLHFFPQSFYCDGLYRTLPKYDFVGKMDGDFYSDLVALGEHFGPIMQQQLRHVFDELGSVEGAGSSASKSDEARENVGVETRAAGRLHDFYTARTVKRVLELYSVDYIMLNLTVPQWALDVLEEGEREEQQRHEARSRREGRKKTLTATNHTEIAHQALNEVATATVTMASKQTNKRQTGKPATKTAEGSGWNATQMADSEQGERQPGGLLRHFNFGS